MQFFKQNAVLLTANISAAPAQMGKTMVSYSCVQLSAGDSKTFPVRAILCPLSDVADCSAAIDVPLERLSEIGKVSATPTVNAEAPCQ